MTTQKSDGRTLDNSFIRHNYPILLIFLLGLGLRIYHLGADSLWYDEVVSVAASRLGITELINWTLNTKEGNPPFYYIVLHFWIPLFGDSEFMVRFPSAIFGSLSVFGIYAVGKELFDKKTGLIAAIILATSFFHIRYSQEARAYSLMVFLSLVSFYCLLKLTGSRKRIFGFIYVIASALMLYTHYYGALIIILQNIFCFTLFIKNLKIGKLSIRKWITLQVITGLLFLPGFILWAKITLMIQRTGFWIPEPSVTNLWIYFRVYAGSDYLLIMFIILAMLSVIYIGRIKGSSGIKNLFIKSDDTAGTLGINNLSVIYLLLLWLFFPILVPFLISILSKPVVLLRYTICSSLALYLLVARGIGNLKNKVLVPAVVVVIVLLSLVNVANYYDRVNKDQWREAIGRIESEARYGDVVLVFPYYEKISAEHYMKRNDLLLIPVPGKLPHLENVGNRNIWVVMRADPLNRRRLKLDWRTKYDFISEKNYYGLDVFQVRQKKNRL